MSQRAFRNFGSASINNSLNKFAVSTSIPAGTRHLVASATSNLIPAIWFDRALPLRSRSLLDRYRSRRLIPLRIALLRARKFPSRCRCPPATSLISMCESDFSSSRSDIAVVAMLSRSKCCSRGHSNAGAVRQSDFDDAGLELITTRRLPIRSGAVFCSRVNRFSQSQGSFLKRPPNRRCRSTACERLWHGISMVNRFRPGRSMTTRSSPASSPRMSSYAFHHVGEAGLCHKYMRQ